MVHKQFEDLKLPSLGLGTMRLPLEAEGQNGAIDEKRTAEMVAYAMEHGVNYFDTAYGYHDGNSELVMGKVLSAYPRDSYFLATKFPGYDLSNMDKVEAVFEEQLEKCGVEYFDFYLLHNVCEKNVDAYLDEKYGIMEYLMKQKANGRIRHLGFSAHGRFDMLERFLGVYGRQMEFGQLQLNYLDWKLQDAKAKTELLNRHNIPVWVMEPLRGGSLASLSEENEKKLKALRPDESIPAWAFRFLQGIPGVTVILSGMSNLEQLEENVKIFEEERPLNEEEQTALWEVADSMLDILPCTSCRYCVTHCPKGLDIPVLLSIYNEARFEGGVIPESEVAILPREKRPDACIGCKSCEAVCPQQLEIAGAMQDFVERMKPAKA